MHVLIIPFQFSFLYTIPSKYVPVLPPAKQASKYKDEIVPRDITVTVWLIIDIMIGWTLKTNWNKVKISIVMQIRFELNLIMIIDVLIHSKQIINRLLLLMD